MAGDARRRLSLDDTPALTALAERLVIEASDRSVRVDGVEIGGEIRTPDIDRGASRVARIAGVRAALVAQQRRIGAGGGVVDGGAGYRDGRLSEPPT